MANTIEIKCYTYTRKVENGVFSGWNTSVDVLHNSNSKIARVFNAKCIISSNSAGEMSFTIHPDHPMYNKICIRRCEILLKICDVPIFCGYVEKISDNFYRQRTITCRGVLDYLKDSILRTNKYRCYYNAGIENMYWLMYGVEVSAVGSSVYSGAGWIRQHNTLMGDCTWKHFTIPESRETTLHESTSADGSKFNLLADYISDNEYTYSAIEDKLLKDSGMFIKVSLSETNNAIEKTLHFYSGEDAIIENTSIVKQISYGKNMLDYSAVINGCDVASNIYPFGKQEDGDFEEVQDRLTIKSVNNNLEYIENNDAVTAYGRIYTQKTWSDFTNVSQAEKLKEVANTELQNKVLRVDSVDIRAIDLYSLTGIASVSVLYDVLNIFSKPHSLNDNLVCTRIEYDIDNMQNSRIHFGKTKKKLSSQINSLRR